MSKKRIGGVSYFTPEELRQLRYDDRRMDKDTKSTRIKRKALPGTYGYLLFTARKGRGLRQNELGALIGVSNKTISDWERGESLFPWGRVQFALPEIGPMPKGYPRK